MIFLVLPFIFFVMLYFGIIRLLDSRKKEFLQFLMMYTFVLLFMGCLSYIYVRESAEYWHLHFHPIKDQIVIAACHFSPTFLLAYLLYPFKIIKRSRIIIWILSVITLLTIGVGSLVGILQAFSNM